MNTQRIDLQEAHRRDQGSLLTQEDEGDAAALNSAMLKPVGLGGAIVEDVSGWSIEIKVIARVKNKRTKDRVRKVPERTIGREGERDERRERESRMKLYWAAWSWRP